MVLFPASPLISASLDFYHIESRHRQLFGFYWLGWLVCFFFGRVFSHTVFLLEGPYSGYVLCLFHFPVVLAQAKVQVVVGKFKFWDELWTKALPSDT